MLMRMASRGRRLLIRAAWILALAAGVLTLPAGRATAQEDVAGELGELLGVGEEAVEEAPDEAPEAEPPEAEAPEAEAPEVEPPEVEAPEAPPSEAEEEAAATGYGAAGVAVAVANADLQNAWRMMVHYFRLARFDLAKDFGDQVLSADPGAKAVLALTESPSTGYDLIVKMARLEEMGDVPARLLALADEGARTKRTDAGRIQSNLIRLGEGPRPYYLAMKELKYSGPYVVPPALAMLQDPGRKELAAAVIRALSEMGRPVVLPLLRGLATPDNKLKEIIVGILGEVGYPYALPALKALVENPETSEGVQAAATAAILKIADEAILQTPAKVLFLDLAEKYYGGKIRVADERSATTDVFDWVEGTGLLYRAAPSKVVNEILAARACVDALKADPGALEAVALWVSALMQMEVELGGQAAREADPFLPDDMPSLDFFARAVGQQHLYKVLDRALRDQNAAVAVRACQALEAVANEEFLTLYGQGDVGSPLVMALTYPDQRVRFAAGFALAAVRPQKAFTGAGKVVPILSEALNLEAARSVLLVEPEADNRNRLRSALGEAGWTVTSATTGNQAVSTARAMPRLDVILISSRTQGVSHADAISLLRSDYQTAMTPIIVLSWPEDPVKASWLESKVGYLKAVEAGAGLEIIAEVITALKRKAGSLVLDAGVARQASLRAAGVLKEIAVSSRVYSARRARQSLLDGLSNRPDDLVIAVLEALAEIPDGEITRTMADIAVEEGRSKPVRVAALEALAHAASRVGNELGPEQIAAIQKLAGSADDQLRDAAGTALGGLSLDAAEGAKLILRHATDY